MRLPDLELPFEVHTEASDRALSGVLVQEGHPIAFESGKLDAVEKRHETQEKKMTAVIHCLEIWKHYLIGMRFVVVTKNVANTFFKTQKKLTAKQARWQEFLANFDFVWVHKPGRHNQVVEERYNTHEKEMTAIIHCLEIWKHYLMGMRFIVVTDNVANTFFKTQKKVTIKQAQWQEFFANFDFVWVHKSGRHNQVADA